MGSVDHDDAMNSFPSGLLQPEGSYRFGLEALLLAAMGARELRAIPGSQKLLVAEAGCGCGATILGLALLEDRAEFLGLDREAQLVNAASINAKMLGFSHRTEFVKADISSEGRTFANASSWLQRCTLVLANPPWHRENEGRLPQSTLRHAAFFMKGGTPNVFCAFASTLLRNHGFFCTIITPHMLPELCFALAAAQLGLKRILPVVPFTCRAAKRIILVAQKNAISNPDILYPLVLHEKQEGTTRSLWSRAATDFCPWLRNGRMEINS